MRKILLALSLFLAGGAMIIADADAARVGGGRSVGAQRSVARTAPSATPAKPAQQQQAAPAGQQAAPAAPAPSGWAKWGPLLGGLALGGLLGSLFSGSGFGSVLLLVALAVVAFVVIGAIARRRTSGAPQPVQFAGLDQKVSLPAEQPASAAPQAGAGNIPAGFDTATFLRGAKMNFVKLQLANDSGNLEEIRELTTGEMYDTLAKDADGRAAQQTDVVSLDAQLLEVATEGGKHWASVRFSGLAREAADAAPENFEEVWNLVKPADGSSGWLLAGIQQTH
jgi:predicted lipid-binding transport protein (Tim44 family)